MKPWHAALAVALCACGGDESGPAPAEPDVEGFMTDYFATFDSYQMENIMALFATYVSAEISGLGTLDGADEVRDEWLVPFTTAFPDYVHTVNTLEVDGQRATVDFVFSGTHLGPLLGNEPTGNDLVLPIAGSYDVVGGEVASFQLEYDLAIVLAAIAPPP